MGVLYGRRRCETSRLLVKALLLAEQLARGLSDRLADSGVLDLAVPAQPLSLTPWTAVRVDGKLAVPSLACYHLPAVAHAGVGEVDAIFPANAVTNAAKRFSSRVEHYAKYRPAYPPAFTDFLKDACHLRSSHVVADVGSGTGALAEVFLKNGNFVYAIEPNPDMRAVAEFTLRSHRRFRSVDAIGERTTLPERSVDIVAVGRAFHWLEPNAALAEFARILKPRGWVVIVSFKRKISSPFLKEYDELLLAHGTDRRQMGQRRSELGRLLTARTFKVKVLEEERSLSLEALKGLTLSYSTSPEPDDPRVVPLMGAIDGIFEKYQRAGEVSVAHDVTIYYRQFCRSVGR